MTLHVICRFLNSDSIRSYYFFHSKHEVPEGLGPGWVPRTIDLPMKVVPRACVPDGLVTTVEEYIQVFHAGDIEITPEAARRLT